jgi:hypothetical protein
MVKNLAKIYRVFKLFLFSALALARALALPPARALALAHVLALALAHALSPFIRTHTPQSDLHCLYSRVPLPSFLGGTREFDTTYPHHSTQLDSALAPDMTHEPTPTLPDRDSARPPSLRG